MFANPYNLALRMLLDSIRLIKNAKKHQQITPIVIYNCNLYLSKQDKLYNAFPILNILGTVKYYLLNTFLQPLVNKLQQLDNRILDVEDRYNSSLFTLRAHVLLVIRDSLAIAQIIGTKLLGAALKLCRMCNKKGTLSYKGRKTIYYFLHNNYSKLVMRYNFLSNIKTFYVILRQIGAAICAQLL